jgi:hypothetical protein
MEDLRIWSSTLMGEREWKPQPPLGEEIWPLQLTWPRVSSLRAPESLALVKLARSLRPRDQVSVQETKVPDLSPGRLLALTLLSSSWPGDRCSETPTLGGPESLALAKPTQSLLPVPRSAFGAYLLAKNSAETSLKSLAGVSGLEAPESPRKNEQQKHFMGVLSTIKHRMTSGCNWVSCKKIIHTKYL